MSTNFESKNRPLGTWVTADEYALFIAICAKHNVRPSTFLRALVVDCIAEEGPTVPQPVPVQRKVLPDLFREATAMA